MLLLTDRSLEIPPFLMLAPDGALMYPGMPAPILTVAVIPRDPEADALAERLAASKRRDDAMRTHLLQAETQTSKERYTEQAAARKAQKDAEAARMLKNKMKQREVFAKHFKWDHES